MIVVADTSPPLHLGRIGRLALLLTVVGRVTVPRTVWNELVQPETRADVSAALLRAIAPTVLTEALDWSTLTLQPGSFVDAASNARGSGHGVVP